MKIEYTLSREDWIACFLHFSGKRWRFLRHFYAPFVVVSVAAFAFPAYFLTKLLFIDLLGDTSLPWPIIMTVTYCVACPAYMLTFGRRQMRQGYNRRMKSRAKRLVDCAFAARMISSISRYHLSLTTEGIDLMSDLFEGQEGVSFSEHRVMHVPWLGVRSIESFEGYLYGELKEFNSPWFFIVPANAFSDQRSFLEFVDAVKRSHKRGTELLTALPATAHEMATAIRKRPR